MRKPFIAGNWKMNLDHVASAGFIRELASKYHHDHVVDVAVFPPFTSILAVRDALSESGLDIGFGGQNMHHKESGAFTGEVSCGMLKALGARYVILGHSERRDLFGETNAIILEKIKAAFTAGLRPILCVGESLQIRESGQAKPFVIDQLLQCLEGITQQQVADLIIAYEPIWAIGNGKTATSEDAEVMCLAIRQAVQGMYGEKTANETIIQYGGSVKPSNIAELMAMPNIDGALVGGASIVVDDFLSIINDAA